MYKSIIKRFLDILLSIVLFPLFLILVIVVGLLIYIDDKGSIFYISDRLGLNGETFKMYKFRSMKVNAPDIRNEDGSTFNSSNDPRVTQIGNILRKTSIDEVPQLINVFKGDMSLVGPRPDLPEHLQMYEGNEVKKLEVRPGITGYNQAYFRNSIPWKERIQKDIYYVQNLSLSMDIKIILQTIKSILKSDNIYIDH